MGSLFIDTHCTKIFSVGYRGANGFRSNGFRYIDGNDVSTEIIGVIDKISSSDGIANSSPEHSSLDSAKLKTASKVPKEPIDEIFFIKGPGSLTGLRIGASLVLGIANGLMAMKHDVRVRSLHIFDLISAWRSDCVLFFFTGLRKFVRFSNGAYTLVEMSEIRDEQTKCGYKCCYNWVSNAPEKLIDAKLDYSMQIEYPKMIELAERYSDYAKDDLNLFYPVSILD